MVCIASISSLTRMVPIWAVKAEPERPATMMAVIRPPISRRIADAQKIDGEDLRAEALQLVRALIGQHDADQEGEQAHDRQRVDAGFFDLMDEGLPAQRLLRPDGLNRLDRHPAEIAQHLVALIDRLHEAAADAVEEGWRARFGHGRRVVFALQRTEKGTVAFGDHEGANLRAASFHRPLGAQQKPGAGAVQLVQLFAVDLGLADFGKVKCAQFGV